MAIRQVQEHYNTYEDWQKTKHDDQSRIELVDGEIYMLASPSSRHQAISREIFGQLYMFLQGKICKLFAGPIDVRLDKDTVVVPDIIVVCDPKKITRDGIEGAPDLIVEILSPSTSRRDRITKFSLYRRTGVPEYWIVDPVENTLTVHQLDRNKYTTDAFESSHTATVAALPGFELDLSTIFDEEDTTPQEA